MKGSARLTRDSGADPSRPRYWYHAHSLAADACPTKRGSVREGHTLAVEANNASDPLPCCTLEGHLAHAAGQPTCEAPELLAFTGPLAGLHVHKRRLRRCRRR
jgi:hypothetical protein